MLGLKLNHVSKRGHCELFALKLVQTSSEETMQDLHYQSFVQDIYQYNVVTHTKGQLWGTDVHRMTSS